MTHRWLMCLGFGLLLTIAPSPARALTLQDLSVPGTQFSSGGFTFSNFQILHFSASLFQSPPTLADFAVIPLDSEGFSGGFSLSSFSVFSASVPREVALGLGFTVTGPQIEGFGISSPSVSASAGNIGGNHSYADFGASTLGQSVGVRVSADEFRRTALLSPAIDHAPVNPIDVRDFTLGVAVGALGGLPPVGGFASASVSNPTFTVNTPEPSVLWLVVAALPAFWLGRRWKARAARRSRVLLVEREVLAKVIADAGEPLPLLGGKVLSSVS